MNIEFSEFVEEIIVLPVRLFEIKRKLIKIETIVKRIRTCSNPNRLLFVFLF